MPGKENGYGKVRRSGEFLPGVAGWAADTGVTVLERKRKPAIDRFFTRHKLG